MAPARERILATLRERILAFATSRMGKDLAEDLTQEALLVLEQKYPHVDSLDDLLPLTFQILRFKMNDFRRKAVRRGEFHTTDVNDLPLADPQPDPHHQAEHRQLADRLAAAIARLDGRCREIFRLKLEGRSFPEIQASLGAASINTVYTWDFRCRKHLLELMGGKWI